MSIGSAAESKGSRHERCAEQRAGRWAGRRARLTARRWRRRSARKWARRCPATRAPSDGHCHHEGGGGKRASWSHQRHDVIVSA